MKLGYLLGIAIFGGLTFMPAAQACEGVTCAIPPPPPVLDSCDEDWECTFGLPLGGLWEYVSPAFDLLDLVLNDSLVENVINAVMTEICRGDGSGFLFKQVPGGVLVYTPDNRYYGFADDCP